MTKKDFALIASDINFAYNNTVGEEGRSAIRTLAASLAVSFSILNPRFNREVFMKACGF